MNSDYSMATLARQKVGDAMRKGQIYILGAEEVIGVLRSYMSGEASVSEVADWAEVYDANEWVDFERKDNVDLIFELSSPEINGMLTFRRAEEILAILSSSDE